MIYYVCFFNRRSFKKLIAQNLIAHKLRNRRTGIMYAFSIAFIIFVTVSYKLTAVTTSYRKLSWRGQYMTLRLVDKQPYKYKKGTYDFRREHITDTARILEQVITSDEFNLSKYIKNYAWQTIDLGDIAM